MSLEDRVRATGLLEAGRPVVVLVSGGRDSVCLLDLAATISGRVTALHVNHGLRRDAGDDEAHCRELCRRLAVPLEVHAAVRAAGATGNVQAWAREERYRAAGLLARRLGADVATGHTATDQVETVLYRLAAAPGRRALLGMRPRDGRLVRPLLAVTREETTAHCAERGLPWREDTSNADPAYARTRVRAGLVPALRAVHPAAEANLLRTLGVLRDEAAVLDAAVDDALARTRTGPDGAVAAAVLGSLPAALRRLAFQRLADEACGGAGPPVGARVDEILALDRAGGTREAHLGGGLRAVVAYGGLRLERGPAPVPAGGDPVPLPVPGRVRFADGEVSCSLGGPAPAADGTLDAAACLGPLAVRAWRPGDRMRPLGLGGSRSLQDLFTDRKVPRARRLRTPVVLCDGEIAWVPGVATGERFRVTAVTRRTLRLRWRG